MGLPRKETKQQKKERLRKEKEWKAKEQRRKAAASRPFQPLRKQIPWLVLPPHVCKGFEFWILTLKGDTFLSKRKALLDDIARINVPRKPAFGFDQAAGERMKEEYLQKAQIVMSLLHQNQILRWQFKNFFTKARILRFKTLNEVDPITLDPFKQPIYCPSFVQQKMYVYEAETFAKHLHKKLIHNDGHIAMPIHPKNPFTNEEFTLCQLMGLLGQCRKFGHTSWAIEAFLSARYDLVSFATVYSKPLRLNALRVTMANMKDWDAIDTLYDFIEFQHSDHDIHFPLAIYKWAVHHAMTEPRMGKWRKLCIKYYETDILIDDQYTKEQFFSVISKKTLVLCSQPNELHALRRRALKSRQQAEDGSSSSRDTESEG